MRAQEKEKFSVGQQGDDSFGDGCFGGVFDFEPVGSRGFDMNGRFFPADRFWRIGDDHIQIFLFQLLLRVLLKVPVLKGETDHDLFLFSL